MESVDVLHLDNAEQVAGALRAAEWMDERSRDHSASFATQMVLRAASKVLRSAIRKGNAGAG